MADVSLGGQQDRGSKASRSLQYRQLNGLGPLIDECLSCQPSSALLLLFLMSLWGFVHGDDRSTFSVIVTPSRYRITSKAVRRWIADQLVDDIESAIASVVSVKIRKHTPSIWQT